MRVSTAILPNDIEAYRDRVRHEIMARSGKAVMNGSPDHAAVLVQESLRAAKSEMLILSNRLDEVCFGRPDVGGAAQAFLADPDKKIHILVETALWDPEENYRWAKNPFVRSLLPFVKGGQFTLANVRKDWLAGYKFNFFVVDEFGIRFQEDRDEPSAVAGFYSDDRVKGPNDPVLHLRKIFRDLSGVSDPVNLLAEDEAQTAKPESSSRGWKRLRRLGKRGEATA